MNAIEAASLAGLGRESAAMTRSTGFMIVAGPQCAGKSTVKRYLYSRYMVCDPRGAETSLRHRNLALLPEMRQTVMHERDIHSAIFIDGETELEVIRRDLKRMDDLRQEGGRVYLDETNIFTLAHARCRGVGVARHFEDYSARLSSLDAAILFLDVAPEISWERRRGRYQERVDGFPNDQAINVLDQYRRYLFEVYNALKELTLEVGVPVMHVDAAQSKAAVLQACADAFTEHLRSRGTCLRSRF